MAGAGGAMNAGKTGPEFDLDLGASVGWKWMCCTGWGCRRSGETCFSFEKVSGGV